MADRIDFEFIGTTSRGLSLDPDEFRGMSLYKATEEVQKVLRSIAPDVSFFSDDIVLAAETLVNDSAAD